MNFDKKEMIDALRLEIRVIESGGYYPSPRDPQAKPRTFRDSVSCLNMGLEEKREPCANCFLIEFVPPEVRNSEGDLCHKIPLNDRGDTVESLEREGDPNKLQAAVLEWLKRTVVRLEADLALQQSQEFPALVRHVGRKRAV